MIIIALLAWVAACWQAATLRRRPTSLRRHVLLILISLAGCFTLDATQVLKVLDRATSNANLGRLIADASGMVMAFAVQTLMLYLTYGDRSARMRMPRLVLLVITLVSMTIVFLRAPMPVEALDYIDVYKHVLLVVAFVTIFQSYFAITLVDILRLTLTASRHAARSASRLGMQLMAAASATALLYTLHETAQAWFVYNGVVLPGDGPKINETLVCVAALLLLTGLTIPGWGPPLATRLRARKRRQVFAGLSALWEPLIGAFPEVELPREGKRSVEQSIADRCVEIRDGMWRLSRWRDQQVLDTAEAEADARRLSGAARDAYVTALEVVAACAAASGEDRPALRVASPWPDHGEAMGTERWLSLVASSMPVISAARPEAVAAS